MTADNQPKEFHIKVNTRERQVDTPTLTYQQIVDLAYPGEQNSDQFDYKVSFVAPHQPDGIVAPSGFATIENGMKFLVGKSNRS
jgi:hypothetical protein